MFATTRRTRAKWIDKAEIISICVCLLLQQQSFKRICADCCQLLVCSRLYSTLPTRLSSTLTVLIDLPSTHREITSRCGGRCCGCCGRCGHTLCIWLPGLPGCGMLFSWAHNLLPMLQNASWNALWHNVICDLESGVWNLETCWSNSRCNWQLSAKQQE